MEDKLRSSFFIYIINQLTYENKHYYTYWSKFDVQVDYSFK